MDMHDILVMGIAGRGVLDRQERERLEIAEREGYMAQVAALMTQGYSIDEAHAEVQDFYSRQAAMQAQIAAPARRRGLYIKPLRRIDKITLWIVFGVMPVVCLILALLAR